MNRNFGNNNGPNKNHYADFDEHGNPRTGNINSLSRYNPENRYPGSEQQHRHRGDFSNFREQYEPDNRHGDRTTHATRAYGDFSRGSRYGEGGSISGGGSAYGHSYYGLSGNEGPRITQHDMNRSDSRQYDAYGDYEHYRNRDQGIRFGRSSDGGYINDNRNRDNRGANYYDDSYPGSQRGMGNGNRSDDSGYSIGDFGQRYEDRQRNYFSNRDDRDRDRGYRSSEDDRGFSEGRSRHSGRRNHDW
ncbi:hypothetical protein POKO110462_12735 [Pontibacter korlensis]|uniref:Uncharacterized protein n=1 Tax=Pontibacter korlensis TaxID=400092 RepID=A0A0E3ZEX8_9BACT|nr:hypothetical protein [Pontibacter korlensis]AKD04000.1 hypothetical protein PKOR_13940 [Pontibacter korlensis]